MTDKEQKDMFGELFDGFDPAEYDAEVQERWGESDAYKQSAARTKRYTKADWRQVADEGAAVTARYVALMDAGIAPDSPEAFAVAESHCAYFTKWFYDCGPEMFGNLGHMWVADPRFTKNIDKAREGLAAFQSAVAQAWAASKNG